ncbi:putative coactivator CBP, KIX domain superfamily, mediator complex subunit 15, KIX [Helianthus annuus]|nr:putative coactivator CBP, KIX domain superfamily, mediator complex subunit 15, KIX [Helianthus annuus]
MDPRPTQVASGAFGDWRAQLQRQRMVYKIMDSLKENLPFTRYDRLQELKKIAQRVEHETFTAATCESEYSRKICFMMLAMETRLQNRMRSNPVTLYNSVKPSVPLDSTANGGDWQEEVYQEITALKDLYLLDMIGQNPNGEDWQEEVYQKIKAMKDLYLPDLNYMHQKLLSKLQWHDAHPQQQENEQVEKMKRFKYILERFMQFLQVPKHGILANYKEKLGAYEKQIIQMINSNMRKPVAPQQQAQSQALPLQHMQSLQQSQQSQFQFTQVQSPGNQMNLQHFMPQTRQSNKMPIQNSAKMLPTQVQQSQPQLQQPVMPPHMQPPLGQLQQQQQVVMQQWRLQQQQVIDMQKQRAMPEASSRISLPFGFSF